MIRFCARAAVLLLALPLMNLGLAAGTAAATGGATVTSFTAAGVDSPTDITVGSDGALWFKDFDGSVGRVTTTGSFTKFTDPTLSTGDITHGPDGALWFTNFDTSSIGRISTTGTITNYTDPSINFPGGIVTGPDGALWFANEGGNSIGRITTAGVVTHYTATGVNGPVHIAVGSDGALWFTNCIEHKSLGQPVCQGSGGTVGRITTAGVITRFASPAIQAPGGITAGPDGALWFTNEVSGTIGRITTSGTITHFGPSGNNFPVDITPGPDGALWFTNSNASSIGRITTSGSITKFTDPSISEPDGITAGPDGALWFANLGNSSIGRITVPPPVIAPGSASVAEGNSGTTNLVVPVNLSFPSTQTVTAQWKTVFAPNGAGAQADPATDYTPASGTVTFTPGQTTTSVTISVNGDTIPEATEYIVVQFGNPVNGTMGGVYGLGFGFITNDD